MVLLIWLNLINLISLGQKKKLIGDRKMVKRMQFMAFFFQTTNHHENVVVGQERLSTIMGVYPPSLSPSIYSDMLPC